MMVGMEFRHLKTFARAAELESFTQAARCLELTQAAVSQHVAALEKELSVSLFERSRRAVHLTDSGRRLYDYARQILDLVEKVQQEIGTAEATISGTLRIATSTVPAELVLPELLVEFRRLYPEVCESVTVSDSATAAASVEAGEADVGFVGEMPRSSRLRAKAIYSDELVPVVSSGHRLAQKKKMSLANLRREPIIVREEGSGSRRCVERALEAAGIAPGELSIVMEINSNEAIRAAVERGVGTAFLSRGLVEHQAPGTGVVPVTVKGFRARRQLYVVTDPERMPSLIVREFLDFLDRWQLAQKKNGPGG